jgi:hypothetical protein
MKRLLFALSIWRWNPVVIIDRFLTHAPYDNFDFKTAVNIAHTVII